MIMLILTQKLSSLALILFIVLAESVKTRVMFVYAWQLSVLQLFYLTFCKGSICFSFLFVVSSCRPLVVACCRLAVVACCRSPVIACFRHPFKGSIPASARWKYDVGWYF